MLVCATLAIPIGIAVINEVLDRLCPTAYPPGEWPANAGTVPAYPEQWLRADCERV